MLNVFIYDPNERHDKGITISLTVGGKDQEDQQLKNEFVGLFDKLPRKTGLNNVPYLYLYEVKPALLRIMRHRGLDNALMDMVSVVDHQDSKNAVTIDYLL